MADFLARLAGRTLGLAPTVQPILAPMYALGQQFVGAEDGQEGIRGAWGAINRAPTTGYQRREMSLQDGSPDEPPPGSLVGQTVHAPEVLLPLVPRENEPSIMPIQAPHTAGRIPGGQPATWHRISLERDEAASSPEQVPAPTTDRASAREAFSPEQSTMSDHKGPHPYEEYEVGHDGRPKESSPLQVPEGNRPVEAALVPPVVDVLAVRRPGESKAIRPLQDSRQVGRLGHFYNQGNQDEVVPATQESSAAAPTIQVTIGRIEVQATPPPAPHSQPKRSGPPVMGLEEYLKDRAKGGYR